MAFKYDNLWRLLADKNISKEEFRVKIRASQTTIVKLGRNENVSLEIIDKICDVLHCTPSEIMEYVSDEKVFTNQNFERGEIYYHQEVSLKSNEFGNTMRPVVIIQNQACSNYLNTVLVAPLTSRMQKRLVPTSFIVKNDELNNLSQLSVLHVGNLFPANKFSLSIKIGVLSKNDIKQLNKACVFLLNL